MAVMESAFVGRLKTTVLGLAVMLFLRDVSFNLVDVITEKEIDYGDWYEDSISALGLGVESAADIVSIGEALKEKQENKVKKAKGGKVTKGLIMYYAGLSLAFLGFFLKVIETMAGLSGNGLLVFDLVATGIASFGLGMMLLGKKEAKTAFKIKEGLCKLIPIAEWFMGVGGVVWSFYTIYDHTQNGDY